MTPLEWAWLYGASGGLGFGLVLLSALCSALALLQAGARSDRFLGALATGTLLALWMSPAGKAVFVATLGFSVDLVGWILIIWLESLDLRLHRERRRRQPGFPAHSTELPPRRRWLHRGLGLCFGLSWLALMTAFYLAPPMSSLSLKSGMPGSTVWLIFLAILDGLALLLMGFRSALQSRLPGREWFDRWSYLAALHAFPWLTIHLVTGSVWAYDAWGSYWGWQPHQGWVFIAWLSLAMTLHMKRAQTLTSLAHWGVLFISVAAVASIGMHGTWPAFSEVSGAKHGSAAAAAGAQGSQRSQGSVTAQKFAMDKE